MSNRDGEPRTEQHKGPTDNAKTRASNSVRRKSRLCAKSLKKLNGSIERYAKSLLYSETASKIRQMPRTIHDEDHFLFDYFLE
jgi:hypothetical protein